MALDTAGFDAEVDSARNTPEVTTITFGDAGFDAALTLAGHLEGELELEYDDEIVGPRLEVALGDTPIAIRSEPIPPDDLPAELTTPPQDYQEATEEAQADLADSEEASSQEDGELGETPAAGVEPGSEDTTTTLPVDDDPGFVQAAEAEGAPPGIVPTDPKKAAACR
ncbi:MAG: LytR C-terminal domain-containing protein [Microthrixaceae bacterium]|nr:LytR C-terminal domain-containing protein [Microthrixaceae bacterium]